jgi:hypothetical protein
VADLNIKKIVIPQSDLPPINSDEEKYVVRFRIISDDRNRVSHWSPQYLISPTELQLEDNSGITLEVANNMINVQWDTEPGSSVSYDVWVAWGTQSGSTGLPEYKATITGNYISIPIPAGKQSVQVSIQNMSVPRKYMPSLVIAKTGIEDVV